MKTALVVLSLWAFSPWSQTPSDLQGGYLFLSISPALGGRGGSLPTSPL